MNASVQVRESVLRHWASVVLIFAVRGRRERGGDWGEAVLAEFGETRGDWEAVRWAAGGLWAVWQERRRRVQQLPRYVRVGCRGGRVLRNGAPLTEPYLPAYADDAWTDCATLTVPPGR